MGADAVDVFVGEDSGGVGDSAGGVDMLFSGEAHKCYCYLRAVDTKSQRGLCWRFITVREESEFLFMLRNQSTRERIHGDDAKADFVCCLDAFPAVEEVEDVDAEEDAFELAFPDYTLYLRARQVRGYRPVRKLHRLGVQTGFWQ